ncbi:MAG: sporulation protein YqfD [Oscillospiraceae bacterium]
MFLVRLLRWLRGSVTFLVTGAFPERLINLCVRTGLPLWGVAPRAEGYEANTFAARYKELRPLARRSKARVRLEKKSGLPFVRRRYRRRWGLLLGLTAAAGLMLLGSTRIWAIKVNGCAEIKEQTVIEALDRLGLRPGVRARGVDARALERRMMLADDRISWISVNIRGSVAEIEVKERTKPPETIDRRDRAANIVAACDGQIQYLEIYEGQPLVRVGDTVLEGEVIVSGIMQDPHGNVQITYARAKAIAQVYERLRVDVPLTQSVLQPAGEPVVRKYLHLPGATVPLFFPGKSLSGEVRRESAQTPLLSLPKITLETVRLVPMERVVQSLTEFEAKEQAMLRLDALQRERLAGCKIQSREIFPRCEDGIFTLEAQLLGEKDIAKQVEILTN